MARLCEATDGRLKVTQVASSKAEPKPEPEPAAKPGPSPQFGVERLMLMTDASQPLYSSDVHPVMRQRSRKLEGLPPLEACKLVPRLHPELLRPPQPLPGPKGEPSEVDPASGVVAGSGGGGGSGGD